MVSNGFFFDIKCNQKIMVAAGHKQNVKNMCVYVFACVYAFDLENKLPCSYDDDMQCVKNHMKKAFTRLKNASRLA